MAGKRHHGAGLRLCQYASPANGWRERASAVDVGRDMAKVNVKDRDSLERAYPADAFASDAAQNGLAPNQLVHGVRIGSAPDKDGGFELERAMRHAGEPETPHFLAPSRRAEELVERGHHQAAQQVAEPRPDRGYAQFLDDIVAAAKRFGFRADETPGRDDPRLRGFRGG